MHKGGESLFDGVVRICRLFWLRGGCQQQLTWGFIRGDGKHEGRLKTRYLRSEASTLTAISFGGLFRFILNVFGCTLLGSGLLNGRLQEQDVPLRRALLGRILSALWPRRNFKPIFDRWFLLRLVIFYSFLPSALSLIYFI